MFFEFRYALRTLWKTPRFTLTAISILALGIGANSAVFTVVYSVLFRPLPYHEPDRIAVVLASSEKHGDTMPMTPGDFSDYRAQSHSFEELAAASLWSPTLTGYDNAEQLNGLQASEGLFRVLGVQPLYGRLFSTGEGRADAPEVVVLRHDLWRRRFGGNPGIVGSTITLDGKAVTVIGVTRPEFYFPPFWAVKAEIFSPAVFRVNGNGGRGPGYLRLFGRLKPGVSPPQARAEVKTIAARLAAHYPRTNAGLTAALTPIQEMPGGSIRGLLLLLLSAVACTLLIACANIANLLLARAAERRKEIALRLSLGASRMHVIRQFLAETLILALTGGAVGLMLARWAVELLVAGSPEFGTFSLPRHNEIGVSGAVVAFNFGLALATALLCGIAAAHQGSQINLNGNLKEAGRGQVASRAGRRWRNGLAAAEIALALLVLTGAGLLVESYRNVVAVNPGFDPAGVLVVSTGLAASEHANADARAQFYQEALEQFRALPGVLSASAVNHVPLAGDRFGTELTIESQPAPTPGNTPRAIYRVSMPGYFGVMRMKLLAGRDFSAGDTEKAPAVAVINQAAARSFWPGENPLGKRLRQGQADSKLPWMTVIGVIADVKQGDWTAAAENEIYLPFQQDADYRHNPKSFLTMTLVVRAKNTSGMGAALRSRVAAIDRNISVTTVLEMEQVLRDITWQPRTSMTMVVFFAGLAMLLAVVGIYAVMATAVTARTQEIGVRMALGARGIDVIQTVSMNALRPIGAGISIGAAGTLVLTRLMSSVLYGVNPTNPVTLTAVVLGLSLVALGAALIPAMRAARLDPLKALNDG